MQKSLSWQCQTAQLQICGELTRDTLLPLWQVFQQQQGDFALLTAFQTENEKIVLNLTALTRLDSAGFALLCNLLHHYQQLNFQLQLVNAPKQFYTLADLFGLENWIKSFL